MFFVLARIAIKHTTEKQLTFWVQRT